MAAMADSVGGVKELEVSSELVSALLSVGFTNLTAVQQEVLPLALAGKDVVAKAKTGTGKTMAFLIPSVARLLRSPAPAAPVDPIRVLVLSGTRELASQIEVQAARLGEALPGRLKIDCVLGGTSVTPQRERLDPTFITSGKANKRYGGSVDVLVATPGRLLEHLEATSGFASRLMTVETLVLDEVDQLLDGGFQRDIEQIVKALRLASVADGDGGRQTLAFSATVPDKVRAVLGLALRPDHALVDVTGGAAEAGDAEDTDKQQDSHARITQEYSVHKVGDSLAAFGACLAKEAQIRPDNFKVLVFLPTARQTQFVAKVLQAVPGAPRVLEIHSRVNQKGRDAAAADFRASKQVVLLSSDVSARGVDYPGVTLVVQLGAAASREVYVQRIGRTGRNGAFGAGLLLLPEYEKGFVQSELKGLPVTLVHWAIQEAVGVADPVALLAAAAAVEDKAASETYRAWIMANSSIRKKNNWSKEQFVAQANAFAAGVLGRTTEPPSIGRGTVAQLGLNGIKGLVVVEEMSQSGSENSLSSLASEYPDDEEDPVKDLKVTISGKLSAALKRESKKVKDHLAGLGQPELLSLRSELEEKGEALVLGCKVEAAWLTIKRPLRRPAMKRSGSSSSSLGSLGRTSSLSSLATGLSTGSLTSLAEDLPAGPTPEERKKALVRVSSAGKALAGALAACGGDKEQPAFLLAQQGLVDAKAELAATNRQGG